MSGAGRRRRFGIYRHEGSGLWTVLHPDVPGKVLGTVIRADDRAWYYDVDERIAERVAGHLPACTRCGARSSDVRDRGRRCGCIESRQYLTREDACRGLRGVTDEVPA